MRIVFFLCGLLLLGCQHVENRHHKEELKAPKLSRVFKQEHHLFLNYYFGMTIHEYEIATRQNFMDKRVFLAGEKHACDLNRFGKHHTQVDINNISYHTDVYYEFDFGKEQFEALVKPVFLYDRLVKLELQTLNCFNFGSHQHEFYRNKVNATRLTLITLHTKQFGKCQTIQKQHSSDELSVIRNAGVTISHFDQDKSLFTQNDKMVTIEQKCCDYKPIVIYTHRAYYEFKRKKTAETEMRLENELGYTHTVEEI